MTAAAASPETYRVVQWATCNIGTRALRAVIEHPRLDLVGVRVTNPDKVGRDAGTLCGLDPTGVVATGELEDVLALRPQERDHVGLDGRGRRVGSDTEGRLGRLVEDGVSGEMLAHLFG